MGTEKSPDTDLQGFDEYDLDYDPDEDPSLDENPIPIPSVSIPPGGWGAVFECPKFEPVPPDPEKDREIYFKYWAYEAKHGPPDWVLRKEREREKKRKEKEQEAKTHRKRGRPPNLPIPPASGNTLFAGQPQVIGTERDRLLDAVRAQGGNLVKAAQVLGFSRRQIARKINALGLQSDVDAIRQEVGRRWRAPRSVSLPSDDEIRDRLAQGATYVQIAREYDVDESTIRRRARST